MSSSRVTVLLVNGRSADFVSCLWWVQRKRKAKIKRRTCHCSSHEQKASTKGLSLERNKGKDLKVLGVAECDHYYHLVGVARELLWFWDLGCQLSSNGEPWC